MSVQLWSDAPSFKKRTIGKEIGMKDKLKGDVIPGLLVILMGIFFLITTKFTPNLAFGSTTSDGVPGAGFFPYIFSVILIIFGIALLLRGLKQNGSVQYMKLDDELRINLKMLFYTVIGLIVFLAFWQLTTLFFVGVFLFCIYLNIIFQRTRKFTAIYAVGFTLFVYLVFSVAFSIQF